MLTHLPLGDSGTRLQRHSLLRTSMFRRITSHQLSLSRPTPLMNATLIRATNASDADYPRRQVHIKKRSIPAHQHTCKVEESTPAIEHGPRRQVHITSIPVHQHTCKVQGSTPAVVTAGDEANGHVRPSSSLRFVQYGLDRGGWLALILGHCRCVG